MPMSMPLLGDDRKKEFKNIGKGTDLSRRNREGAAVEIRKQKKEESFSKRRNMAEEETVEDLLEIEKKSMNELLDAIPEAKMQIYSEDLAVCLEGIRVFRQILSRKRNPPIEKIIEQNVIPRFVALLSSNIKENTAQKTIVENIQLEAAWALTNIASGTPENTMEVVSAGALEGLCTLLESENMELVDQAVWGIGNIAGDSATTRDMVNSMGVLSSLFAVLQRQTEGGAANIQYVKTVAWTLSNLVRGKPAVEFETVRQITPAFVYMQGIDDDEILSDSSWGLSYITDGKSAHIDYAISCNIISPLVRNLSSRNSTVVSPSLRALGNIVTGNDLQTQAVVDSGILFSMDKILSHSKSALIKEACWMLSNITAGTPSQIKSVVDAGLFPKLIYLLKTAEFKIKKEACWAVSNATSVGQSHPEITDFLVENDAVDALCSILGCNESKIISVALDGIKNILEVGEMLALHSEDKINSFSIKVEECGGLDKITELQEHKNHTVYGKSKEIIDNYFYGEDEAFYDDNESAFTFNDQTENESSFSFQ